MSLNAPEKVISDDASLGGGRFDYSFHFSVRGTLKIRFESSFVDAVQRLRTVRLEVYVGRLRPATELTGFRQGDALADKTGTAVKQFSRFRNGEQGFTFGHCVS